MGLSVIFWGIGKEEILVIFVVVGLEWNSRGSKSRSLNVEENEIGLGIGVGMWEIQYWVPSGEKFGKRKKEKKNYLSEELG